MRKIGLIGLGVMGSGMAETLLNAGYSLVIWNRTAEKTEPFAHRGATIVSSPQEVSKETEVIITMLSADQQVKDVLLGVNGVIESVRKGQIVIDSSTVSPQTSRLLYQHFAEKEAHFLDAPVTGSAPQAKEGNLGFMVGGPGVAYEQCMDLFEVMGKSSVYMGESGSGSTAKLISNTMVSISLLSLCEGLAMAQKSGLDVERFLSVVRAGGANSRMVEMKSERLVQGDFSTQFAAALMNKDLGLAARMADDLQLVSPALRLSKELFMATVNKGLGNDDVASVFRLYQEWGKL